MTRSRVALPALLAVTLGAALVNSGGVRAFGSLPTPERFLGFKVGADNLLARWDRIVEYMRLAAAGSDRVRYRELGKTTSGAPFIVLEISSPDTLKNLDRYKQLERRLYFQGGAPSNSQRDEIFRQAKVVVLVTCNIHAIEIGDSQMTLELVHGLATDESPAVAKILDNVILLLVPSLNPDGQMLVTDWFHRNVGTPYEGSPIPYLYHPYAGHDNNRDMYMFTQRESQFVAKLAWHDWFPAVWLDQHQMGGANARIFVMPATDPINPNVHPLIYRWNTILGQSQAAALEAAGKTGIIHGSMYTNFWEGAMAWSGWWHNQIGLLTEVASVRIASPADEQRATDLRPRTEYPRPWTGGRWTLRDIVDYELIATMGLLEAAADARETILRQIYEVNRQTIEAGRKDGPSAIVVPLDGQQDPREAAHLIERLQVGGAEVYRADAPFLADGTTYRAGTFVIPMAQVFARFAKDVIEKQTYPEVRRGASAAMEPPYDVTAWSLGMLLGVNTKFVTDPITGIRMTRLGPSAGSSGEVTGTGARFMFEYRGPDTALAINRLLKAGGRAAFDGPSHVAVTGVSRQQMQSVAGELGLAVSAVDRDGRRGPRARDAPPISFRAPRIGLYQPWTGGLVDEGWTRWVLEQYGFDSTPVHNADIRAGKLRERFDAMILADQSSRDMLNGLDTNAIRPEYRGGIGDTGADSLRAFVADGGTLITLGNACEFAIDRLKLPVSNLKRGLTRDQHYGPGAILRIEVDTANPLGYGVAPATFGFYINSPFFALDSAPVPSVGSAAARANVVARYPGADVLASGWLKGEELMTGRAAVVSVEMNPGRVVLFGLRPQHRAQTHATFPLLFNALYLSATNPGP